MGGMAQNHAALATPPRKGEVRVLAVGVATAAEDLAATLWTVAAVGGGTVKVTGPTIVRLHAQGGDVFVLFSSDGTAADPADTAGNGRCDRIPADQERDYVLSPTNDLKMSARTSAGTATLRYRIAGPRPNLVA